MSRTGLRCSLSKKNVTFDGIWFSHDDMIQRYNASEHFNNLTSVGGAVDAIKKLSGDFDIIAITLWTVLLEAMIYRYSL